MAAEAGVPEAPNYVLQDLQPVVLPPPVPWWPLAPGGQLLVSLLIGLLLWRTLRHWWRNAYRRQALRTQRQQQREIADWRERVQLLAPLLKRVALQAYPRTEIAALSGEDWLRFLDGHCGKACFDQGRGALLLMFTYQPASAWTCNEAEVRELERSVATWIRTHRA